MLEQLEKRRAECRAYKARNREKVREYNLKYRQENREKIAAKEKQYRLANRETVYEWNRNWSAENPEKVGEIKTRWAEGNPDRRKAVCHAYRGENREKCYSASDRSRKKNPGKYRAIVAARRARRLQAEPAWVDREALRQIYMNAAAFRLTVDHIVPLQNPLVCGLHVPWNLQLLSGSENSSKGNRFEPITTNAATDA